MSSVKVKVEGLRELDAALGQLSKGAARGVLRRVLERAAQPIAKKAVDLAPDDPNGPAKDLKWSIRISSRLKNEVGNAEFAAAMRAGRGKAAARQALRDARRASNEGSFAITHVGPVAGRNASVGMKQEFGVAHHPPHAFMRPAWDAHSREALEIIKRDLGQEIGKAVTRAQKRAASRRAGRGR